MKEAIYHPNHYADGKYECLEVMTDVFGKEVVKDFCVCNAFKYIWRHKKKGGDQDLEKAANYLRIYLGIGEERMEDILKVGGFEPVSVDEPLGDPLDPVYDRFEEHLCKLPKDNYTTIPGEIAGFWKHEENTEE